LVKTDKHRSNSVAKWPTEEVFLLGDPEPILRVTLDKGEWLGLYRVRNDGIQELACAGCSPRALYRKAKRLHLCWPMVARRVESKRALFEAYPDPLDPRLADHVRFVQLMRWAFEAIVEARKRADPNFSLHPANAEAKEAAMIQAKDFLDKLANQLHPTKKRGRKTNKAHSRRMIEALKRLRPSDEKIRSAVTHHGILNFSALLSNTKDAVSSDGPDTLKASKSLRTQLMRFCLRVHGLYERNSVTKALRAKLCEECGFEPDEWSLVQIANMCGKALASHSTKKPSS
jgi:hypothetical protein